MIDITGGNVAPLKATLMREGERFPVADAQDLAVALVSQSGRKTVLGAGEYRTDFMEEGVLYADGPATLTPGRYGLEVKGWMNGTPWRTYAPSVLKVTYATAPGGEQAAVSGDDGDIVMEVQLYKQTGKIPTKTSELTNDSHFVSDAEYEHISRAELFSGRYEDLQDKPVNVSEFANDAHYLTQHQDISGKANTADLAQVAFSGSYNSLQDKPVIPTVPSRLSAFQNDTGFITSAALNGVEYMVEAATYGSVASLEVSHGKYYVITQPVGTLSISLVGNSNGLIRNAIVKFKTGSSPAVTISSASGYNVKYFDGYKIEANTEYELNFVFNGQEWIVAYGVIEQA